MEDSYKKRQHRRAVSLPSHIEARGPLTMSIAAAHPDDVPAAPKNPVADPLLKNDKKIIDPVIPQSSDGESAAAWGDGEDDNGARLLREVPPHWGR